MKPDRDAEITRRLLARGGTFLKLTWDADGDPQDWLPDFIQEGLRNTPPVTLAAGEKIPGFVTAAWEEIK